MNTSTGKFVNNNISEIGEYYFSGVSETGTTQVINDVVIGALYSLSASGEIVLTGAEIQHSVYSVSDNIGNITVAGSTDIFTIVTDPLYSIASTGGIVLPETDQDIFSHSKIYSLAPTGQIATFSASEVGLLISPDDETTGNDELEPTVPGDGDRLVSAIIFKDNININNVSPIDGSIIDYNSTFINNLEDVPIGAIVFRSTFNNSDNLAISSIVLNCSKTRASVNSSLQTIGSVAVTGAALHVKGNRIASLSGIAIDGYSEISTAHESVEQISNIVLRGANVKINSSRNNILSAGIVINSPSDSVTLGKPGYAIKSTSGIIAYNNFPLILNTRNNNLISNIVLSSKTTQQVLSKGKRPLRLNDYPFVTTNGLDDVAVYLGVYRLPGETDNNFLSRIKRIAKVKYGTDYKTSIESINEQLGNSLVPLLKIESVYPFTINITDEYIELVSFNNDGSKRSYTKVFTNIQNIISSNGVTIYSPLIKLLERVNDDFSITILNEEYKEVTRESIFRGNNFKTSLKNIINKKRTKISMSNSNCSILPSSFKDDGMYMIERVSDIQSINGYGKYFFDEDLQYLELFADNVQPFSLTFTEYEKSFIIKKANINAISISNYIKYGISNNFINMLFLILNNKVISE